MSVTCSVRPTAVVFSSTATCVRHNHNDDDRERLRLLVEGADLTGEQSMSKVDEEEATIAGN
jgi:hypothetical protein